MQTRKLAGLLAAACLALAAFGASAATAEVVPGLWSGSSIKISTSGVTVEKNGAEPKVCTMTTYPPATGAAGKGFNYVFAYNRFDFHTELNCPSGKWLTLGFYGALARYDTSTGKYFVEFNKEVGGGFESPWGWYSTSPETKGTFTNGSGATPSTLSLDHVVIGTTGTPILTLTGTFTVTTSTGGLLTLSH